MPKERQTCTECSMRRQKCDRNQPCSRCIKRGEPDKCTREWPKGGYDPRKHRVYPRPEKGDNGSPSTSVENEQNHESPRSPGPVSKQMPTVSTGSRASRDLSNVINPPPTNLSAPNDQEKEVLEFLTWGRGNLADYQVKSFDLLKEPFKNNARPCPEQEYSNGFGNAHHQQLSFLQLLLPRREQVFYLIDYHIKTVLWYHACFHGETFRNELQAQYTSSGTLQLGQTDLRWSALLFAIMSATMACANEQLSASWGFQKGERAKLMRQWYKASLTCLNLSDYMWRHHLNSISAICVLTMSGHILGFSNTQSTLHGAGLKIAQGLGLQRLSCEPDEGTVSERDMNPARREKILRREIGRRVWGQLCNQDWFSIPFSEMYTIQKSHFSTLKPQHIDEKLLLPLPAHEPSATSFTRCLNDIAAVLPQAHDALTSASTLYTKYEQILHYDAKMKSLSSDGIPSFFSMNELIRPEWPEWLPWARRSLRICFAHKTIMVHRSFLGKSLSDPTFSHTRKTCMDASKTILKEARQAQDTSEGPALWIDQAFMVAAGITLSLDIFHRKTTEPEYEEHRKLVETTVNMLRKFDYSMIAIRGVRLLTSLLAEQARLTAEKSMNNYRKRAHDDTTTSTTPGGTVASPDFLHVGDGGSFTNAIKRQKFDVPKFLETFVGGDTTFTQSLRTPANPTFANDSDTVVPSSLNANGDLVLGNGRLGNVLMQQQPSDKLPTLETTDTSMLDPSQGTFDSLGLPNEYGYEAFEQIFPAQAGISNSFLFEDLLNFEL